MNILVNASNLGGSGGAAQVADSICRELYKYTQHHFVVVLSESFGKTKQAIEKFGNIEVITYSYPKKDWKSLLTKRNSLLDKLVESKSIECVLTIFGPVKWVPKCKHLCGLAYPHIPLSDTIYFLQIPWKKRFMAKIRNVYMTYLFKRCANVFYTENELITELVKIKFRCNAVYTITNNYNQIFDTPDKWSQHNLVMFEGARIFSASSMMQHKNLPFTVKVAKSLKNKYPTFKFQFVLTVKREDFVDIPSNLEDSFLFTGSLHISEIPFLYKQCDMVIQPSLLECFSASYPEAMKMGKPLIVPDLVFAKGLCKNAAAYYSPLDADQAADLVYRIYTETNFRNSLVEKGKEQLLSYDTFVERAAKLIKLCEEL